MAYYITIDGGTTNTRIYLFEGRSLRNSIRLSCGASNGREALAKAVHDGLYRLCETNGIDMSVVRHIVASGMIGSELGLCDAARVTVPTSVEEMRNKLVTVKFDDICSIPITFIPGLLQCGDTLDEGDLIRGEETEAVGLITQMKPESDVAVLLPGTHNKLMLIAADGTINAFYTAMSGDLIRAAEEHTILSASLAGGYTKVVDADAVLDGYDLAERIGLTAALFKLRVADKLCGTDARRLYAMLLGIVLHEDVTLVENEYKGEVVLISGSEPFRSALYDILCVRSSFRPIRVEDAIADASVPLGALEIAGI